MERHCRTHHHESFALYRCVTAPPLSLRSGSAANAGLTASAIIGSAVRRFRKRRIAKDEPQADILRWRRNVRNLAGPTGVHTPMIVLRLSLVLVLYSVALGSARAERGMASFYGGGRTASGEITRSAELTAAHRTLPFGTHVLVTNVANGKTVVVRITDRGPFGRRGRIIDVSRAAARELDMIGSGTILVSVELQEIHNEQGQNLPAVISVDDLNGY
jgi:rare lipoprotein A